MDDAMNHRHQQVVDLLKEHLNEYDLANEMEEKVEEEQDHKGKSNQVEKDAQSAIESANHPPSEIRKYC